LVQELGALEHILAVCGREDEVILGEVVPHEPEKRAHFLVRLTKIQRTQNLRSSRA
jgi:hypothetical protein